MARGRRAKCKSLKKPKMVEMKAKEELVRKDTAKKAEEKTPYRPSSCFKSEEIQEIRQQLMHFDEMASIEMLIFYINSKPNYQNNRYSCVCWLSGTRGVVL